MNRLNQREQQIANLITYGRSNSEIAQIINITQDEVNILVKNLYNKFEVTNRVQLTIKIVKG